MITISCGDQNKHPQSTFFDWVKLCGDEESWAYAEMLKIMDFNNCKIYIHADCYNRENSLFIKKFIEDHINKDGYVEDSEPDYVYWPLPDYNTLTIKYNIHQFKNDIEYGFQRQDTSKDKA